MSDRMPVMFIVGNGICGDPEDTNAWTDVFCRDFNRQYRDLPHKSDRLEYRTGAVTRRIEQDRHTKGLVEMVKDYARYGFRIMLCGHSNFADIISRGLVLLKDEGIYVDEVHLIAPAGHEKEFDEAIVDDRMGRLFVYYTSKDSALRWARRSKKYFSWLGLGYDYLGLYAGEVNWSRPDRVLTMDFAEEDYDHNTFFQGDNLGRTLNTIINNSTILRV